MARDREIEQERRARERRDRDRRRSRVQSKPKRRQAPRRAAAAPVASRERHEGLVGWVARSVMSLPAAIARLPAAMLVGLRGVAHEVGVIVTGIGRATVGRLPGVSRLRGAGVPRPRPRPRRSPSAAASVRASATAGRTPAQARAAAERRARLQKRVRLGLVAGLLVSVFAAWIFVPASNAFRIRHVEITGASSVDDLEIRTRIDKLLAGRTIYTVDEAAVERRIEELPFVREARVERHIPGGLQVHISEYRPLALGYGDGDFWLVAHDGRILAKANKDAWTGRIPTVTLRGEDLKPGVRVDDEPALQLLTNLRADSTLAFDTIRATEYELIATLVDGVELRFGRPDQLLLKVAAAERTLQLAARHDERLLYVDVSVPGRPARCLKTDAACFLPRGPETAAEQRDGESTATTPEETGGDEADVSDVLA
jgi:cell division protein FtsQ